MLRREDLPLETSFGSSNTTLTSSHMEGLIKCYCDSIVKLKNEINELKNYHDNAAIMIAQYDNDLEYIQRYRKFIWKIKELSKAQIEIPKNEPQSVPFQPNTPVVPKQEPAPPPKPVDVPKEQTNNDAKWEIISNNSFYNKMTVRLCYIFDTKSVICSIQFDPTGNFLAFSDPQTLYIISAKDGKILTNCNIVHTQHCNEMHSRAIKFSPDGKLIATSIAPTSIGIFSILHNAMIQILDGHLRTVITLEFSRDSKTLISGGMDGIICVWDLTTMKLVKKVQHGQLSNDMMINQEGTISSIVSVPNSDLFAVGFLNGCVGIYDKEMEKSLITFKAHNDRLLSLITTPKGEIVTTSVDKSIKVWSLTGTPTEIMSIEEGHSDFVTCACSSYTSDVIITGSKDESIKAWNIKQGAHLFKATAHTNTVLGLAHHPQSNLFASCSGDGLICVWAYQLQ